MALCEWPGAIQTMDGLPSLFSSFKQALLSVERAIPPVFESLPPQGEITKDVTAERRSVASLFAPVLDRWLTSLPDSDDRETASVAVEEDLEGRYTCDDEIRDSLRGFHAWLQSLWPVECETPHKLMLKLALNRQYEPRSHQKLVALDTLSSGHDGHWGRIVFTVRWVTSHDAER